MRPAFADLDGDGLVDLVIGKATSGALTYYKNVGSPTAMVVGAAVSLLNKNEEDPSAAPESRAEEAEEHDNTVDHGDSAEEIMEKAGSNLKDMVASSFTD